MEKYDFSGWATKNDLLCSDGRIIRRDAFKDCDGAKVPLVWNHQHNDPTSVIGHAILHNTEEGVYAYCYLNDSKWAEEAKHSVVHGDVTALSIFANKLKQVGSNVVHGVIREVSLVLAGANPGASIDSIICHGEESEDSGIIYTGEPLYLYHSEENDEEKGDKEMNDKTVQDVVDSMTEEQRNVMYALIGKALEDAEPDDTTDEEDEYDEEDYGGDDDMKHNVFENDYEEEETTLCHADMQTIIGDAKRYGSLKDSFLAHAEDYGIDQIEYLFPDAKTVTPRPEYIQRDTSWVRDFMGRVHRTAFSRIKSIFANITEDEARAKGYIKGNLKKEEVFALLKRTTEPTTIYKKQKLDKNDVDDITDFDVVAMIKAEMRGMLDEEIARAALVGDGRSKADDDHIDDTKIRPIYTDEELYTIKARFDGTSLKDDNEKANAFIRTAIKARKNYKGSGNPILYTTEDVVTDCLLLTDTTGRDIYDSVEKLATKLRVSKIVTVPVMEGIKRIDGGSNYALWGIIVNPTDYNMGADKGGAINMFDDFDIDYNQMKYLIETRCSGALTKPYSAIVVEMKVS